MNLIITCSRHLEEEASNEISKILCELGDASYTIEISPFSGIITVTTTLNPLLVVNEIRRIILDEPWSVRYCHRFIPSQETAETSTENIVRAVQNLLKMMKPDDTYRITIEKRGSHLSSKEVIDSIAKNIQNKVSLEKFDWNVIIEILGITTGISVLKENDVVSTLKMKRDLVE